MPVHLSYNQLKFLPKYYTKEKKDFGSAAFELMKNYDLFLSLLFHRYHIENTKKFHKTQQVLLIFATLFEIDRSKKSIQYFNKLSRKKLDEVDSWTMFEAAKVMIKIASMIANTPRIYSKNASVHELLDSFDEAVKMDRIADYTRSDIRIVDFGNIKLKYIQVIDEKRNAKIKCPFCDTSKSKNTSFIVHIISNHVEDDFNSDNPIRKDTLFKFMTKCAFVFELHGHSIRNYFGFFIRALYELRTENFVELPLSAIENFMEEDEISEDFYERGWRIQGSFESNQK